MNGFLASARIKWSAVFLAASGLFFSSSDVVGQSTGASTAASSLSAKDDTKQAVPSNHPLGGVEILTDTHGVDFGPYVKNAMAMIKKNWIPLIPEEARPPTNQQGETLIRFSILPDGKIGSIHLDESSGHTNIDRAAWGGIVGVGQFPPLPAEYKGQSLELRIDFFTNRPVPLRVTPLDHMTGGASIPK